MGRVRTTVLTAAVAIALPVAGCGDDGSGPVGSSSVDGVTVPAGFTVEIVAEGFEGPTQIVPLADGGLLVAELNGGEGETTGRVILLDAADPAARTVLVEGLDTPTGLAVDGDRLWIMERRRLTVGPLANPGDRTVVADDLPFNGRSEGTLTALAGGGILYDTSGSRSSDRPAELRPGTGTLWSLESPGAEPVPYATGFKHAYAQTFTDDGELFVTEISDGRLDGVEPPDELLVVSADTDFGYPRCVGDGDPVAEVGATADTCADTPRSHALFEPGATPTSVAVAPWDPDLVVVALWNRGEVVTVPVTAAGRPHRPEVLITGVERPQHLVAAGDRLLLGDFAAGRVLAITGP